MAVLFENAVYFFLAKMLRPKFTRFLLGEPFFCLFIPDISHHEIVLFRAKLKGLQVPQGDKTHRYHHRTMFMEYLRRLRNKNVIYRKVLGAFCDGSNGARGCCASVYKKSARAIKERGSSEPRKFIKEQPKVSAI